MGQLYYTMSSLPALVPGVPPPFTWEGFWDYVYHVGPDLWLGPGSAPSTLHPAAAVYRDFDLTLRQALAKARLENVPWKDLAGEELGFNETSSSLLALEALAQEDPLRTEEFLDAVRWSFLDDMEYGHQFDEWNFYAYAFKLQILIASSKRTKAEGVSRFESIHADLLSRMDLNLEVGVKS